MSPNLRKLNEDEKSCLRNILQEETLNGNAISPTKAVRYFLRGNGGRCLEPFMAREYYEELVNRESVFVEFDPRNRPRYRWVGKKY